MIRFLLLTSFLQCAFASQDCPTCGLEFDPGDTECVICSSLGFHPAPLSSTRAPVLDLASSESEDSGSSMDSDEDIGLVHRPNKAAQASSKRGASSAGISSDVHSTPTTVASSAPSAPSTQNQAAVQPDQAFAAAVVAASRGRGTTRLEKAERMAPQYKAKAPPKMKLGGGSRSTGISPALGMMRLKGDRKLSPKERMAKRTAASAQHSRVAGGQGCRTAGTPTKTQQRRSFGASPTHALPPTARTPTPTASSLPSEWKELTDADGNKFYHNEATKAIQKTFPGSLMPPPPSRRNDPEYTQRAAAFGMGGGGKGGSSRGSPHLKRSSPGPLDVSSRKSLRVRASPIQVQHKHASGPITGRQASGPRVGEAVTGFVHSVTIWGDQGATVSAVYITLDQYPLNGMLHYGSIPHELGGSGGKVSAHEHDRLLLQHFPNGVRVRATVAPRSTQQGASTPDAVRLQFVRKEGTLGKLTAYVREVRETVSDLPAGWSQGISSGERDPKTKGKVYYTNLKTNKSTWNKPPPLYNPSGKVSPASSPGLFVSVKIGSNVHKGFVPLQELGIPAEQLRNAYPSRSAIEVRVVSTMKGKTLLLKPWE